MPAPRGNRHATKHGLTGAKLPKGCSHIERSVHKMRRELERLVLAKRGQIDVTDAALIQSAQRHEVAAQLAMRWLRRGDEITGEPLPTSERLQILSVVRSSTDARDRVLERLDLRVDPDDFSALRVIEPESEAAG